MNLRSALPTSNIVRHRQSGSTIQEDLYDFVVVPVGRQDQWRDVGRERGRIRRQSLPALKD